MNVKFKKNEHTCYVCGGKQFKLIFKARPLDYCLVDKFRIMRCSCNKYAFTEIIDSIHQDDLYSGGNYDQKEGLLRRSVRPILDVFENRKAKWLYEKVGGGRLLEVGCGKGRFLLAAKKVGFEVYGIEPAKRSYVYSHGLLGDDVSNENIGAYSDKKMGKFDVIVLWHVFEHIDDIDSLLKQVKTLLAENGVLLIAVPNFSSFQAWLGKESWYHLDPPRHLHHFTPVGMRSLISDRGFDDVSISSIDVIQDVVGELITWLNASSLHKNVLINLIKNNEHYFKKTSTSSRMLWIGVNLILLPIYFVPAILTGLLTSYFNRAGTFQVIARYSGDEIIKQ